MAKVTREFTVDESLIDEIDGLEPTDRREWRHGHSNAYVIERDGRHWRFWVNVHHEDGWQLSDGDAFTAVQVESEQVTIARWRPVNVPPLDST